LAAASTDAGRLASARETGATPMPVLPVATEHLEIAAIGKSYNSKIIAFAALGDRVWLSGRGLDAFADGEGPLGKGYDVLEKLPYKQGVHHMEVVGRYPKLFAMRYKDVESRADSPEPTLFVYHAADNAPGTWTESEPTGIGWFPHAFAAFKDGAVLVTSQIQRNAGAYYTPSEGPGTLITFVGPDGKVTSSTMGAHNLFMAWDGSAHGDTLSLLGTVAAPPAKGEMFWSGAGMQLVRIGPDGAKQIAIMPKLDSTLDVYSTGTRQSASGTTIFSPSPFNTGWQPDGRTFYVIGADNQRKARTVPGGDACSVVTAELVGDQAYVIRRCYTDGVDEQLLLVGPDSKSKLIPMPRIVKAAAGGFRPAATEQEKAKGIGCAPLGLVVRPPSDLWVRGQCGGVSIVARLGKAQEPIAIP